MPLASIAFANATATALLPLAVGPAMSATGREGPESGEDGLLIVRLIAEMPDWETRLSAAKDMVAGESGTTASARRLESAPDVLQWRIEGAGIATMHSVVDRCFGPVDRLLSEREIAIPQVFVSDMDSTMIGQECIDELADYAGLKDRIAAITERAMLGDLDFEAALRERVGLLSGLEESAIERCLTERIRPNPGARELVQTLKAKGTRTVLVTGGFHHFADVVGQALGFDRVVGNRLEVAGGVLTGELAGPISDASTKARVLDEEVANLGEGAISVAIGDGANDVAMIERSTFGFAYCAKPAAKKAAAGWVESGNLTCVLSLLGIDSSDFIKEHGRPQSTN